MYGLNSKQGDDILKADKEWRANIIHHISHRSYRIPRSVIVTDVYALFHAADVENIIRESLSELLKREIVMDAYVVTRK